MSIYFGQQLQQNINFNLFNFKMDDQHLRESLISDDAFRQSKHQQSASQAKPKPIGVINGTNIIQNIFFIWIFKLLRYGSKNPITVEIMPSLTKNQGTEYQYSKLSRIFKSATKSQREGITLTKACFKAYGRQFIKTVLLTIIMSSFSMFSPFLMSMIMEYIQHRSNYDISYGEILFAVILVTNFGRSLSQAHMGYKFTQIGLSLTNSLTMMIYCKSLKYASQAQKSFSESQIINYSQVDAERMTYLGFQLTAVIVAPITIAFGIFMMFHFIGISFVTGIVVLIIIIIITYFLSKIQIKYNDFVLKAKDERMKVTQQMLDIIRYIKINAIEKFFFNKVNEKRASQINFYKKLGYATVLNIFIFWSSCPLILSSTFVTYIMLGYEISSQVAFTTIMIFSLLQFPIRIAPSCLTEVIQIFASIKRIQKYLLAAQMKYDHIRDISEGDNPIAIKIERGNFYWGVEKKKQQEEKDEKKKAKKDEQENIKKSILQSQKQVSLTQEESLSENINQSQIKNTYSQDQINGQIITKNESNKNDKQEKDKVQKPLYIQALKDINTTIQKGKFTILIGDIGSGKSSLILAILNEMKVSPKTLIQINGSLAYAAQKPWIMSSTVKENIIFSSSYDQAKFNEVIHYASLEQDIKIFPTGVMTQIGEKGINLSGGQKARLGLARALYSQKDIYLLDDILSAVDVHVGDFLMKQTLMGYLKGKTIIMPTHAVKFAEFVDEIIIMKKGRIVRKGHYNDISTTKEFQQISIQQNTKKQKSNSSQQQAQKDIQIELTMLKEIMVKKSQKIEPKGIEKLVEQLMLPQDHVIGKIDYKIFKQYIHLNGGKFRFAFLVTLAMFFWIVFTTSASIVMEHWCENSAQENYDLYIYISLSILSNVFILFRAYTLILSGARQGEIVHKQMLKSLLYASLTYFYNRVPIGRIVNRLTKDLRELDQSVGLAIGSLLVCFFQLLGTLTICIYGSSPYIIFPIIIVMFISNKIRNFYMKTQRQVARFQKSTNSPIVSGFMSAINGLSSIRAYQKQQKFIQMQMKLIDLNKKVRLNKAALQSWFSITLTYVSFLINMLAIGYCIFSDNGNASLAGLLMNYALNLSDNIINFISCFAYFETKIISLERIFTFMKIEPQKDYKQYCLNWQMKQQGYKNIIENGKIEIKNMSARYRSDLPKVIKGLNCIIQPGQKIGIVGRTGAGKTTIINTLMRITQISEGDIFIDGKSIQQFPLKDLRNGITMIDQEPTLIKSTFRQNLDITKRYSDEELLNILKECNLYQVIISKGGLEGEVSNDSLSVGEKQLLCICRAFLKHSKIVLIDEATANIDLKNDEIIQRVIAEKFKQCTVLTIAHRLSTLESSDKIMVMEDGNIIQFGTHSDLQSKPNGFYREMILKNAQQFLI